MSLVKIQFLEAGEWCDHPADPIFKVKKDEKKEVSVDLANAAVDAGKAIFVHLPADKAEAEAEAEAGPTEKAEAPKAGPKAKAEGKNKGKGKR